jgi:hypothetical protein
MADDRVSNQQLKPCTTSLNEPQVLGKSLLLGALTQSDARDALVRARELVSAASLDAAAISGTLGLRPGPSGWAITLPEVAAIWRLQAQMVTDIGKVFGKNGKLTQDSALSCLFRHAGAQFLRELVNHIGETVPARRDASEGRERSAENIGTQVIEHVERRRNFGLLALLGAIAVAAYAYYDTDRVGQTAIEFFRQEIELT